MIDQPADPFAADEPRTLGQTLDALGITDKHEPGEYIVGAVVLLKVLDSDGDTVLRHRTSPGLGWIEKVGMLRASEQILIASCCNTDDD